MSDIELNRVEIANSDVARKVQGIHDFAAALAATPQFQAFTAATEMMEHDPAAQDALHAFQAKQQEIKMAQTIKPISPVERDEYERLRQAFLSQPSVAACYQAQADLVSICQAAGDMLSNATRLNFGASASSSGCC